MQLVISILIAAVAGGIIPYMPGSKCTSWSERGWECACDSMDSGTCQEYYGLDTAYHLRKDPTDYTAYCAGLCEEEGVSGCCMLAEGANGGCFFKPWSVPKEQTNDDPKLWVATCAAHDEKLPTCIGDRTTWSYDGWNCEMFLEPRYSPYCDLVLGDSSSSENQGLLASHVCSECGMCTFEFDCGADEFPDWASTSSYCSSTGHKAWAMTKDCDSVRKSVKITTGLGARRASIKSCQNSANKPCAILTFNNDLCMTPKGPACLTVTLTTDEYGVETSWSISDTECNGSGEEDDSTYNSECCMTDGDYILTCTDSYGDGWNGAYIHVGGVKMCGSFTSGASQTHPFTVSAGVIKDAASVGDHEKKVADNHHHKHHHNREEAVGRKHNKHKL